MPLKSCRLAFDTNQTVVPGVLYGDFQSQTARKLFTPTTTHLFEPLDPTVITQTIVWMQNTFKTAPASETKLNTNLIYLEREVAILAAIVGLFGIVFLAFFPITRSIGSKAQKNSPAKRFATLGNWRAYIVWDALNLALFLPMVFVGFAIAFPPLIFGASIAWWMLATGIIGLLLMAKNLPKLFISKIGLKETLQRTFDRKDWLTAIVLFIILFVGRKLAGNIIWSESANNRALVSSYNLSKTPWRLSCLSAIFTGIFRGRGIISS